MTNYITIGELANNLGIYEYEIQVTTPSGSGFSVADTLTGVTSLQTMVISRMVTTTKFFVTQVSGVFSFGETIGNGTDTAKIIMSDSISIQQFIKRAQSIIETITRKKLLNTGVSHTVKKTTRKNKKLYKLPTGKLPIISIISIVSDGNTYTGTDGNGFELDKENGLIDFNDNSQTKNANYHGNLIITYLYGNASATVDDIPEVIIEAVVSAVHYMWERYNQVITAPGATSINPAGFSMSFKQEELFDESFIKLASMTSRVLI